MMPSNLVLGGASKVEKRLWLLQVRPFEGALEYFANSLGSLGKRDPVLDRSWVAYERYS